jgi:hypothetical protein
MIDKGCLPVVRYNPIHPLFTFSFLFSDSSVNRLHAMSGSEFASVTRKRDVLITNFRAVSQNNNI